jgi:hypothetical protein
VGALGETRLHPKAHLERISLFYFIWGWACAVLTLWHLIGAHAVEITVMGWQSPAVQQQALSGRVLLRPFSPCILTDFPLCMASHLFGPYVRLNLPNLSKGDRYDIIDDITA